MALLVVTLLLQMTSAIQTTVHKASSECFSVDAQGFKHGISLNYEVLHGVAGAFRAQLTDGKGGNIFDQTAPSGRYVAPIGDGAGVHTVCFQNEVESVGDVVVGFSFHADDPSHEVLSNADATKIKQVQEMEDLVYELSVNLDTVKDTQSYMKAIKQYHLQAVKLRQQEEGRDELRTCSAAAARDAGGHDPPGRRRSHRQAAARVVLKRAERWSRGRLLRLRPDGGLAPSGQPAAGHRAAPLPARWTATDSIVWTRVCIVLQVGGATGMIGDPSGKSEERVLLTDDVVAHNASQIIKGLSPVLDFDCPKTGAVIVNNAEWHTKMSAVDWMRDIGSHFRVNAMLTRDSVKKRMDSDQGISFLEFSYQLFQAYDFLHLYRTKNCVAQIGGSDQWGNIASGCELVRKTTGDDVFGVTLPLLTTASGEKYGKSAGNAIWLDAEKTSVFDFYQYFLRSDDRDVEQLLKSFTFMDVDEIRDLVHEHAKEPEKREAQKVLAERITTTMHGAEGLQSALTATSLLFGKQTGPLTADQVLAMAGDAPLSTVSRADVVDRSLVDLCVRVGAAKSKAECRRLIKGGGLYLNNEKVESEALTIASSMLLDGKLLLLRTGRRNNFIVQVE